MLLFPILIAFFIPFIVMEKIIIDIESALDIICKFLCYYHFIHSYSSLSEQASAPVVYITYFQQQAKH